VFISDTTSISWSHVTTPSISHTTIMGLDGTKVQAMIAYGSFVLASYKGGLLATTDNGATWIAGGNQFNLPSYTNVNKIAFVDSRVFVTTDNNCIYSNALSELPLYAATKVLANVTCNGLSDGAAEVSAAGGAIPYMYLWSNGATTSFIANLKAQTYTVIVSDAGTKKDTTTVTITEPAALSAIITSTEASMENMNDGTANAVISGGTAPYNYLWSNSKTTAGITGLAHGDYSLFVTDTHGCELVKNTTVTYSVTSTSIENLNGNSETITISPNPNNGIFTIGLKNVNATSIQLSITDIMGKEMQNMLINNTGNQTVNVDYPAGIYFVKVVANGKAVIQKLVIQ
jgi:Secretion system C-terminal sorting domain/SprB repeat